MVWGCLCWVLLLTYHTVDSLPLICNVENHKTVKAGDSLEVPCTGSSQLEWCYQKPGFMKWRSLNHNYTRKYSNQLILSLADVQRKHAGRYTCTDKETGRKTSFHLFVKDLTNPFHDTVAVLDVGVGQDASGICPLSDSDVTDYAIQKCGQFALPGGFFYEKDVENGLTIKNVQANFDGCYVCTATLNGMLKSSNHFHLMVMPFIKLPEISLIYSELFVMPGNAFDATCVVKSNDFIEVEWKDIPSHMTVTRRISVLSASVVEHYSTLSSEAVQYSDTGAYTCQAQNRVGAVNATFTLTVTDNPALWGRHILKDERTVTSAIKNGLSIGQQDFDREIENFQDKLNVIRSSLNNLQKSLEKIKNFKKREH